MSNEQTEKEGSELEMWKKRALRAEEKLRIAWTHLDSLVEALSKVKNNAVSIHNQIVLFRRREVSENENKHSQ